MDHWNSCKQMKYTCIYGFSLWTNIEFSLRQFNDLGSDFGTTYNHFNAIASSSIVDFDNIDIMVYSCDRKRLWKATVHLTLLKKDMFLITVMVSILEFESFLRCHL